MRIAWREANRGALREPIESFCYFDKSFDNTFYLRSRSLNIGCYYAFGRIATILIVRTLSTGNIIENKEANQNYFLVGLRVCRLMSIYIMILIYLFFFPAFVVTIITPLRPLLPYDRAAVEPDLSTVTFSMSSDFILANRVGVISLPSTMISATPEF